MTDKKILRDLRKEAGITIKEACEASGTSLSTWNGWEAEKGVNMRRVPKIAISWLRLYIESKNDQKKY